MSNLALVDRFNAAIERRDAAELEQLVAPDAVWDLSRSRGLDTGIHQGHDQLRALLEGQAEAWEGMRVDRVATYETDDLLAEEVRVLLTGSGSGVEIKAQGARVYEFRDGKIARFVLFQNMDEARAYVDAQP